MSELLQTMDEWRGRIDAVDGEAGRRWHQVVQRAHADAAPGVALLGFGCDAGVKRNHGRCGAAAGPRAVRKYLANLAWHGNAGDHLYDAGDVACRDDALEAAQAAYAQRAATLLRAGHRVIGLGGGHEIAWASYQGIAAALHDDPRLARLGIVNFDAHFDLRQPEQAGMRQFGHAVPADRGVARRGRASTSSTSASASARRQTRRALYARAAELGVRFVPDVEIADAAVDQRLRDFVQECDAIYCTFCLDVLPPAVAPGVSAPSGLGVPLHRAIALLRLLRRECRDAPGGDRLVLADIAELAPCFDAPDARTARTAARIAYELAAVGR